jgi:transposase
MLPQSIRIVIKYLAQEGLQKTEIARHYGISRETVRKIVNEQECGVRIKRRSKLDPFKDYIEQRLRSYNLSTQRLFLEIQEQGYTGSYSTVKPFVRQLKNHVVSKVTERYETRPGKQAQLDWGECGVIVEKGQRKKLYVFTLVLGYSRMLYAHFTTSMSQPVLLECLQSGFKRLGVPQKVLVDNMKTAVDLHRPGESVVWNKRFLDFAEHHGFLPVAAPPYWPRVKGKIESSVHYVKSGFLEGRSFIDLRDLNGQLDVWLDTRANVREHGTTREKPIIRFQEEMKHLRSLTGIPSYAIDPPEFRKVAWDCHLSWKGVRYSVPPESAGQEVEVIEKEGRIRVVYKQKEIACHERVSGIPMVTLPEHMQAARLLRQKATLRKQKLCFEQQAEALEVVSLSAYDCFLEARV